MADNIKFVIPEDVNLNIERNGKTVSLHQMTFGKKSPLSGKPFFAPVFTVENLNEMIEWAGVADLVDGLNTLYRKIFQDIWTDCLADWTDEKTGVTDWASVWKQLQSDWPDFSAGVVKLSSLEDQMADLVDQQQALLDTTPDNEDESDKMIASLKELAAKIRPLKQKREEISAKYQVRADKRKAKKVAQEVAAAAAKERAEAVGA